jgi:hypothetical protein
MLRVIMLWPYLLYDYAECRVRFIVMVSVVMPNVILLGVVMISVLMLNVIILSVVMLSVLALNVITLNVVMLSVMGPFSVQQCPCINRKY